jgi:DNA-binding transcriptional MerR regulator
MIRSYTVDELQMMSGLTRRTISDYIAKGLLSGPSHRGRGARYSQADADALRVLPRIRTLMKKEFPTVESLASFFRVISQQELRDLACQPSGKELDLQVRRIRVRVSMAKVLPSLAPERLSEVVASLSPEQICGIDRGQYQLGAILDLAELFQESKGAAVKPEFYSEAQHSAVKSLHDGSTAGHKGDRYQKLSLSGLVEKAEFVQGDRRGLGSVLRLVKPIPATSPDGQANNIDIRLGDIADRLLRLEKLLG